MEHTVCDQWLADAGNLIAIALGHSVSGRRMDHSGKWADLICEKSTRRPRLERNSLFVSRVFIEFKPVIKTKDAIAQLIESISNEFWIIWPLTRPITPADCWWIWGMRWTNERRPKPPRQPPAFARPKRRAKNAAPPRRPPPFAPLLLN